MTLNCSLSEPMKEIGDCILETQRFSHLFSWLRNSNWRIIKVCNVQYCFETTGCKQWNPCSDVEDLEHGFKFSLNQANRQVELVQTKCVVNN